MSVVVVLIGFSILVAAGFLLAFLWAVRSGFLWAVRSDNTMMMFRPLSECFSINILIMRMISPMNLIRTQTMFS